MTRWMASFILIIVSFSLAAAERYYLSVCAIFQNEAPYLKEWIEYLRLIKYLIINFI